MWQLVVCLFALSYAQLDANDECLANSVAKKMAQTFTINTGDSNNVLLAKLYAHLAAQTSQHAFKLYVGFDNGNFVGVWNCWAVGALRSPNCNTASQYVGVLVNGNTFGNNHTHAFVLDGNGNYNAAAMVHESATDFNVKNEPFYKVNGWQQYVPFSGAGYEFSFSIPFTGGVLAGIREPMEPCTACLTHSYPKAASILLSNLDLSLAKGITTVAQVEAVLKKLFDVVAVIPDWRNLYFGLQDGTYYGIYNCKYPDYVAICQAAGGIQYFANIKNTAVPGLSTDGRRDRRVVDVNGRIGATMDASTSVFDTVNRPWYLQKYGWTMPFTGATAGTQTRGYCVPFNGGVIVSDIGAPCTEFNTCPEPEPCPECEKCDSSTPLSAFAALLMSVAIFALL